MTKISITHDDGIGNRKSDRESGEGEMSKPNCKQKRTFHTNEEAVLCAPPGIVAYQCGSCGYWHLASKGAARKTDWKQKYSKRKRK